MGSVDCSPGWPHTPPFDVVDATQLPSQFYRQPTPTCSKLQSWESITLQPRWMREHIDEGDLRRTFWCSAKWSSIMKTMKRHWERINCEGVTRVLPWGAQGAGQRATCRAAKTTVYLRAQLNAQIPSFLTRIQRTMGMWRVTAKSLTGGSRWSSARRAASGSTSPAPRSSAPPSQTSGTAPSARRKVQKATRQKLEREQKRGRIRLTASSARRLQVSRRSHNKEDKLPIIDSGSVLLRLVCLPQYKAPVSRAPSIHLSHHPTFSHECLNWGLLSSQTIFLARHQEPFSIKCLSDYQCSKTDFR